MYTPLLIVHSYLRWLVLLAGLLVIVRALMQRRAWSAFDDMVVKWFGISLDVQVVIGLILYFFLSPFTMSGWSDIGATMRDGTARFIVIEHQFGMLIALALTHIGRARMRRAPVERKARLALIFLGLAVVIMVISIPWPGRPGGRELFRGLGL